MTKLKEMRAALSGVTNTGGVEPNFGSVEINARIDKQIQDAAPTFSEIRNLIPREAHDQGSVIWNVRTTHNTSTSWGYSLSESGSNTNTPAAGSKVQLSAAVKTFRTDWEVEGLFEAMSQSYYSAIQDEIMDAVKIHVDDEEKQIMTGNDAGGYGSTSGFLGLKQIVNSFVTIGDTTSVFGVTRASGKTYMDAGVVDAGAAAFKITHLDSAITEMKKRKGIPGFFVVSYNRADQINQELQAQQRFAGTLNLEGGFTVATYQGIPIISSIYMDRTGEADGDTKVFLISANNLVMKTLADTQNVEANLGRYDAKGGYIKTYEVLQCKDLIKNVVIDDLVAP